VGDAERATGVGAAFASTLGETGVVAVLLACAAPAGATRGGCGDMAGFAGPRGVATTGFAGAFAAPVAPAWLVAGRGAAPMDGLPPAVGEVPVAAPPGAFGA
jgi:hypothetical protein